MNTNENNEELELVNVGRIGISYSELKELHNLSMVTLSNMSKVLPQTIPRTPQTMYSSKDVEISRSNNNFLVAYHPYKEPCHICRYFGHGMKNCPNVKPEFRGCCVICWESGHSSGDCRGETKAVPFNEHYTLPEDIVNRFIL